MRARPRIAIVAGPDVEARLPLIRSLEGSFEATAYGTNPASAGAFEKAGVEFVPYPMGEGLDPGRDLRGLFVLERALARRRPSIVHAFDTKPCVLGRLAARLAGIHRIVGTLPGLGRLYSPGAPARPWLTRAYECVQRAASAASTLTVFQNADDLGEMVARGVVPREKAVVVPGSGIDEARFDPQGISDDAVRRFRSSLGIEDGVPIVAMVARVLVSKGVRVFAAAARDARVAGLRARFLLAGPADPRDSDTPPPSELDQYRREGLWIGISDEVPVLLKASAVAVLPTAYREGIPRALLEAGCMGLPLIATDMPGCRDIVVDGETGFRVPLGDVKAVQRAVTSVLGDPERGRQLGRAARARVLERFTLRQVASQIQSLYHGLLGTGLDPHQSVHAGG